ncbi:stage V sporulation protein B [Shouchella lonarensis]|uniref:Stage V sporulation protein B n=1 Tax=Shouchella lonarensis TaxID=1464122 RepID=A0A1G6JRT5_9BACI|nr:stage V sporulation protein B [Shouchella lonarensis]SDC20696.1 stage V sporulation protein B [Shouchella lonarensis]
MTKQTFLTGTLILIAAGFITKVLGFINRIVMARILGSEGVGLYMMAVPTLLLILTLTQMGLPVAIAKLVAEAEARGERQRVKKILAVSLAMTAVLSVIFTTSMIAFAPIVSNTLLTDARAFYPLIAITPIVPIVAISSVIRGYFQGRQNMKPTAYSQVIEQVIRITFVAVLTTAFLPLGLEYAAAGAMLSVVLGELASLFYMLYLFKHHKSFRFRHRFVSAVKGGKHTCQALLFTALPTTGSRLIGTVSLFFEPIVVAQSLAIAGIATSVATSQYGLLVGYVVPLLTLPSFITYALSVSLLPNLSEAAAKKNTTLIHYRLEQTLRIGLLSGGICVIILYVFATDLMTLMYDAPEAAGMLKIMAPFALFLYIQGPLQAALQALNYAKVSMMNSLFGAVIKTAAIFALSTHTSLGIMGAALAIVTGFVLVSVLHFASIAKTTGFVINARAVIKLSMLIFIVGYAATLLQPMVSQTFSHPLVATLSAIGLTTCLYMIGMFFLRLIKKEELKQLPLFSKILK